MLLPVTRRLRAAAVLPALALVLGVAACGADDDERVSTTTVVEPGRPGEEATTHAPGTTFGAAEDPWTEADAVFLVQMVPHHEQALAMARLAPGRAENSDVVGLASRIADVQQAEIDVYVRWLADHGMAADGAPAEGADDGDSGHSGHSGHEGTDMSGMDHSDMAGMASAADLTALEASSGAEFDRRWLELMVAHHQGALDMAAEREQAGGQNQRVSELSADVVATQTDEIARMRAVLGGL